MALREQMFREIKQSKDDEITRIKQMNRDLEARLGNLLDTDYGN